MQRQSPQATTPPTRPSSHNRWRAEALCAQADPELFFPDDGANLAPAIAVCGCCPVQSDCLTWALEHQEPYGIWGGTTERQRRRLRHLQVPPAAAHEVLAALSASRESELDVA